jgi:tRNA pseudouridine65 synthase
MRRMNPLAAAETLPVLYQDAHLVAVHKPSGLLVHRTGIDRHETRFAMQIVREQTGRFVFPVHRLDKGTSGVLVFAFDAETARRLGAAFDSGAVRKQYLAVVRGSPPESGRIDHALTRLKDDYAAARIDATPQDAVTRYRCLAHWELPYRVDRYPASRYALLELEPLTGRRHQLRRHMKHIAHPIIGDATYGKGRHNRLFQTLFDSSRLLLACTSMTCGHPVTGAPLKIEAALAAEFAALLKGLDAASTGAGALPMQS